MTPEQLVCSFELSKSLWDAGIRLETYFYWNKEPNMPCELLARINPRWAGLGITYFPAPTASELGEILSEDIGFGDGYRLELVIFREEKMWNIRYVDHEIFSHKSLAEDMGQMVLWLKQNGYLEGK